VDRHAAHVISEAMQALYAGDRGRGEALLAPGRETIFEAAAFGRVGRLEELLSEQPDLVRSWSDDGFTPLHLACFAGGSETTRLLVERGADLEALARASFAHVRPLGTAAFSGDRESATILLEAGADPNGRGKGGFTPLHTAAQNGDLELVRLLLRHGADADVAAADGRTPADLASEAGHEQCAALLAHGTWPKEPS
jgi:ankyrin repeat protein